MPNLLRIIAIFFKEMLIHLINLKIYQYITLPLFFIIMITIGNIFLFSIKLLYWYKTIGEEVIIRKVSH